MAWALKRGQAQCLADWEWRLYWRNWRRGVEALHARRAMAGTHRHMYR